MILEFAGKPIQIIFQILDDDKINHVGIIHNMEVISIETGITYSLEKVKIIDSFSNWSKLTFSSFAS